jgi:hypothetical protein
VCSDPRSPDVTVPNADFCIWARRCVHVSRRRVAPTMPVTGSQGVAKPPPPLSDHTLEDLDRCFEAARWAAAMVVAATEEGCPGRAHFEACQSIAVSTTQRLNEEAALYVAVVDAAETERKEVASIALEGVPLHTLCETPCEGPCSIVSYIIELPSNCHGNACSRTSRYPHGCHAS